MAVEETALAIDRAKWSVIRMSWIVIGPALQAAGIWYLATFSVGKVLGEPNQEITLGVATSIVENTQDRLHAFLADERAMSENFHKARMAKLPKCSK